MDDSLVASDDFLYLEESSTTQFTTTYRVIVASKVPSVNGVNIINGTET